MLSAVVLILVGCSGGASQPTPSDQQTTSDDLLVTTPEAKGEVDSFTWNLPFGEPTSLDPIKSYYYSENTVLSNVCEGLLRVNPDGSYGRALAESFSRPDPVTWVYKIRSGVRFWDGSPLTADDVVFSLNRHKDPKLGSYYHLPWGSYLREVRKTGPVEVTVKTVQPESVINAMMATGLGTIAKADHIRAKGDAFGTAKGGLMCTGPFKLDRWDSGREISLVRNDDYWDQDHRAHADRVVFKFITDAATLTNALISGQIDGTYEAPVSGVDQLRRASTGKLYLGRSLQAFELYPTGTGPTGNLKVRQAISLAIDRQAIASTVYSGAATPLKSIFVPGPFAYGTDILQKSYDAIPEPKVDLDAARRLVAEAGSPAAPIASVVQAGDAASLQVMNAIADAGRKIGLRFTVRQLPPPDFISIFFDPAARRGIDLVVSPLYFDVPDPLWVFNVGLLPGSVQNFQNYANPRVIKLITDALATDDDSKRAILAAEAMRQVDRDLVTIPIVAPPQRLFMSNRLTGAPAAFPYLYYPWAADIGAPG